MVTAIEMASTQLDALGRVRKHELVRNVLLIGERIDHTDIALQVNIIGAEIHASGLGEWQVQFELAGAESEGIGGEMKVASDIYKFQIPIAQATGGVASSDADIVIHAECYVASQVTSREYAE